MTSSLHTAAIFWWEAGVFVHLEVLIFPLSPSAGVCCSSAAHHEAEVSVNHKGCEVNSLTETRSMDLFLSRRTVINKVCFKSLLPDFSFTCRMLDELAAGKFFLCNFTFISSLP